MSKKRLYLKIFGEVQGVSFRYYAEAMANDLGLSGWIRNVSDGAVECEVEGEEKSLNKFLEWAKQGPKWARVKKVEEKWKEFKDEFRRFETKF
jgi:acylphosphatase